MTGSVNIDFSDPEDVFGRGAAEYERDEVFKGYFYCRDIVDDFTNYAKRLRIVTAYKGEGKSALLRYARAKVQESGSDNSIVAINVLASDISPDSESSDFEAWVRLWKAAIMKAVAVELGNRIGFAWSDDSMSLVEEARNSGFRSHGLVGGILRRLPKSIKLSSTCISGEVEYTGAEAPGTPAALGVVKRSLRSSALVWVFIDDIDREFKNEPLIRTRAASFLIAALELTAQIEQLRIRTSLRPNVWATLVREFAALSHVREDIRQLYWDEDDMRGLLARRIEGYLIRTEQYGAVLSELANYGPAEREKKLISYAFHSPVGWGKTCVLLML